jgi:glycine/D-amino acid oxidase-like deaminating enzyme/nitrite reductase/ring-hydroxylating ferredoxin subunit
MNQKSTSLWRVTSAPPTTSPLSGDLQVDVAIVGAGITGITAALLLKERGRSVAVLEKESIGAGETGNTTAHLTEAVDARYHYLRRTFGTEEAKLVASASHASLEKIAELVSRHGIDCHFRRVPGYLYTEKRKYIAEVKNEVAAAKEAGLDVQWTDDVPLPFATRGAALFANQAQFHPGEYLNGLAARIDGDGCHLFGNTMVTNITEGEPCIVETERGRITAKAVLMATNTPIAGYTTLHTKSTAYRTYALAFRVTGEHPDGLFWDTADPYHYTRWQETDAGTFLIIGGEDHKVGEEEDTEGCFARLLDYCRQQFGVSEPEHRWSGQIIEPHDGLPFIGGGPLYVATGYSGQGMTFGTLGAMMVTDLISGIETPWKSLFDPMRVHMRGSVREFMAQNLAFPGHMISDRLISRDVEGKDSVDVKSGEGKILAVGGRKVACYRDEAGTLHSVSPVCTHMRCDVAFNDAEKTWDCPCHGSRFTPDGDVLNGPAHKPLERIELEGK